MLIGQAGYFMKVAARSGNVDMFNRATEMMAQDDKVQHDTQRVVRASV